MSGFPPLLSFEVDSAKSVHLLTSKLRIIARATSLGGVHSTIDWRYKYDHNLPPGLLRFSIGIEDEKDLIDELRNALEHLPDLNKDLWIFIQDPSY